MAFKKFFSRNIKKMLLVLMAIGLGATIWSFIDYRNRSEHKKMTGDLLPKANIRVDKIRHSATKDGKTEWSLEAESAEYTNENQKAVLKDLIITFFMEDHSTVRLSAEEGILTTNDNNIQIRGNVILKNQDYRLKTSALNYNHEKRIIFSDATVEIDGETFNLSADKLTFNLNTNQTTLTGNVKGSFNEII